MGEAWPRMAMRPRPPRPPPPPAGDRRSPRWHPPLCILGLRGWGRGRRGQGQGVKVETGKLPCVSLPHTPGTGSPASWSDPSSLAWLGQRGRFHAFQRGQARGSDASKVTQPTKGSGPPSVPATCPRLSPSRLRLSLVVPPPPQPQAHAPVVLCSCGVAGAGLQPELPRYELDSALLGTWGTRDPWVPQAHLTVST